MNPGSLAEAVKLAKAIDAKGVVICPPFPFLSEVKKYIKKAKLGAQNVFWENPAPGGAYTGEVSATMLKKIGAEYVILGHSERRVYLNETDEIINKKLMTSLATGLKPVLCIGEPRAVRGKGISAAKKYVAGQLKKDLRGVHVAPIIAYEPIWAIGTGKAEEPSAAAEMAGFIKSLLASAPYRLDTKVLYGGSVTSMNILRIISYRELDGALVGGASLKSQEFKKIIKLTK